MEEDEAALLAELRAISNKSAVSRFGSNDDDDVNAPESLEPSEKSEETQQSKSQPSNKQPVAARASPPWKRQLRVNNASPRTTTNTQVVVDDDGEGSQQQTAQQTTSKQYQQQQHSSLTLSPSYGIKSDIPSTTTTFKGERGGVAEDAELLALLRGVSASASRFDSEIVEGEAPATNATRANNNDGVHVQSQSIAAAAEPPTAKRDSDLPPWKKKHPSPSARKEPEFEIAVLGGDRRPVASKETVNRDNAETLVEDVIPLYDGIKKESSSFSGERGGKAEDAELLALLRGVSAKSSSASRFSDEADADVSAPRALHDEGLGSPSTRAGIYESSPKSSSSPSQQRVSLPPWKRKDGSRLASAPKPSDVEFFVADIEQRVAASTASQAAEQQQSPSYGVKSDQPSTFKGERGGFAEDAELLALLRGVSAKSSSASRFNDDTEQETSTLAQEQEVVPASPRSPNPSAKQSLVPPWKRRSPRAVPRAEQQVVDNAPEKVLSVPEVVPSFGIKSDTSMSSAFKGERGGSAEDAQLLALLRGVSAKSSSSSRFDDEGTEQESSTISPESEVISASPRTSNAAVKRSLVPPWKRPTSNSAVATNKPVVDNTHSQVVSVTDVTEVVPSFGIKSDTRVPSTFKGTEQESSLIAREPEVIPANAASKRSLVPPWKRQASNSADTKREPVVESASTQVLSDRTEVVPSLGIKSDAGMSSTFKGERGGSAEDEELLALLRGVSAKSSSASRFDDEGTEQESSVITREPEVIPASPRASNAATQRSLVPPWKRQALNSAATKKEPVDNAPAQVLSESAEALSSFGFKSDIPSTFSGERGGSAEDAELLALLRGVSAKSTSTSRFSDGEDASQPISPTAYQKPQNKKPTQATSFASDDSQFQRGGSQVPPLKAEAASARVQNEPSRGEVDLSARTQVTDGSDDIKVGLDDLPQALHDKSWKVRMKAYDLLSSMLSALVSGQKNLVSVDSNQLVQGLDEIIPKILEDANASALDKALDFALLYADHCSSAGASKQAARIVSSLIQKNAFSSRPSTLKAANTLTLKLMEVGTMGVSSLHSVVDILLTEGLASKKPKVVQASASLINEAATEFGASKLPLASVVSFAPKMLSHSNPNVRNSAVQILAEICRSLGSKTHIQDVIKNMKKAQLAELDALLLEKPVASPIRRNLRSLQSGSTAVPCDDAVAALQAGAKELAAQRFAARPAVNLMKAVSATDYASRIGMAKWSEKVAALSIVLECGGEKPYKLVPQSPSSSYVPLIIEMKKLLGHTHFAVCAKSMEVLGMLADGVGESLFPHLRPLLIILLKLSKDKKLTNGVSTCLDSFFGNVLAFEHLLDREDGVAAVLDEHKEKNALARTSAMEFIVRCIQRNESSGPRGSMTRKAAAGMASLCLDKLDDSSATVRKASMDALKALQECDSPEAKQIATEMVESLKEKNPRVYKLLVDASKERETGAASSPKTLRAETAAAKNSRQVESSAPSAPMQPTQRGASMSSVPANNRSVPDAVNKTKAPEPSCPSDQPPVSLERALSHLSSLRIPQWDAPEEDGGILSGLESSKWMFRQDSIKSISAFIESGQMNSSAEMMDLHTSSLLMIVGEHTRGFKETNVNIMKSILQLFRAVCDVHEATEMPVNIWVATSGIDAALSKISDKKLSDTCKSLLTALCVVARPSFVLLKAVECLKTLKSPIAHEEFLKWIGTFCRAFGAASIGSGISEILPCMLEECGSSNLKVKREAHLLLGIFHTHIGPTFKAIALSLVKPVLRDELEKCFEENAFDPTLQHFDWPKRSLFDSSTAQNGQVKSVGSGLSLEIPRSDLTAELGDDIIQRLQSKEGKASWKIRKEAMDEVDAVLKRCSGLLDVTGTRLKFVVDLSRALRDRLLDTQINLKPVAARIIGVLLSVVDKSTQAKLGRIFYAPLVNACMNDIKKPMRDASLEALRSGIMASALDGGRLNDEALEALATSLVSEVTESSSRAGGLPDVLQFLLAIAENFPNLDEPAPNRGQPLGEKFSDVLMVCLTSSKTDTRAAATSLLDVFIEKGIVGFATIRKAAGRLKPANQRTVGPLIAKYASRASSTASQASKENDVPVAPPLSDTSVVSTSRASRKINARPEKEGEKPQSSGLTAAKAELSRHPLIARGGQGQKGVANVSAWLEYPEEPNGVSLFSGLKQSWSGFLPPASNAALFPATGIKKQDDAQSGCDLISRAIEMDKDGGGDATEAQLEFILKWLAIVLCSKEATVGLQALLRTINDLFRFLLERERQLSDTEAFIIIPFLIEKASNARGRFRDLFMELVSLMQHEVLISTKTFGPTVCVAVLERSSQSKARALACRLCVKCLEKEALAGVGKRGVLVLAKVLSEETVPENKAAALEAMMAILSMMNGDMQRLGRVCGPNLNDKVRQLLEERWAKTGSLALPVDPIAAESPRQQRGPSEAESPGLQDQLPKLSLREGIGKLPRRSSQGPTSLNVNTKETALPESECSGEAGSAAALRARLQKIRAMAQTPEIEIAIESAATPSAPLPPQRTDIFNDGIARLATVVSMRLPLEEEDENLLEAIQSLKQFHAALSKQQYPAAGLSLAELNLLREQITRHLHETAKHLTSLIRFAFDCGPRCNNVGMSIPLLSVCLATLMALFRDPELSAMVSQEDLIPLIRDAGIALLDSRLAASSELDESTASQMVRAINKLAVQAATGASRNVSFQSLLTLQQQLIREMAGLSDETAEALNSRLSRVISKLFARVVKAEEAMAEPYSADTVDLESLICSIEDVLLDRGEVARASSALPDDAVLAMTRTLTESIVQTYGSRTIVSIVHDIGLDPHTSQFMALVSNCESPEEDNALLVPSPSHGSNHSHPSTPSGGAANTGSYEAARDVATLVSALGSAQQGPSREKALDALRDYVSSNGEEELVEHLKQVSHPFRAFIEEQLRSEVPGPNDTEKSSLQDRTTGSMSARLKSLRTRLEATEIAVQTVVEDKPLPRVEAVIPASPVRAADEQQQKQQQQQFSPSRSARASRLAQPTPSKLLQPSQSRAGSASLSLRERLVASQESRIHKSTATDAAPNSSLPQNSSSAATTGSNDGVVVVVVGQSTTSSSIGPNATTMHRAAALRARLEAVKQKKPPDGTTT